MFTLAVIIYLLSFSVISSRILLYNTENDSEMDKFDCIYSSTYLNELEISYCQRPGESFTLIRNETECENEGKKKYFRDLLDADIEPNELLKWNSGVEMVDLYARVYYNRLFIKENDSHFICQCTQLGTFGKYCEYQLTHNKIKFSHAIQAQFDEKKNGDSWNTQRYGDILCYETLRCDSSPLCLDWREICDGVQRCSNGTDEENCDKLEFNECEDDEFRCANGMCIAEEFWFDGVRDCMDWSDEYWGPNDYGCPFTQSTMECDEHLCSPQMYSCGDGQCVPWVTRMAFQRLAQVDEDCFNKRNLNYMCEFGSHQTAWTLENGLCWPDRDYDDLRYPQWNITSVSNLTNEIKCEYLFRCLVSNNFEHDCPCHHLNCKQIMSNVCPLSIPRILYPPPGLINANVFIYYEYLKYERNANFYLFALQGGLKCQGYFSQATKVIEQPLSIGVISNFLRNQALCHSSTRDSTHKDFASRFQIDEFCWNGSLTFNGHPYAVNPDVCTSTGQCISQYRIRDGAYDCLVGNDENMILETSYCTGNVGRHRFQCYNHQNKCLQAEYLGEGLSECSNSYDESWYGNGISLREDIPCVTGQTADCHRVKQYIQQSSSKNTSRNDSLDHFQDQDSKNRIAFRSYCDSFWNTNTHMDELSSSCQHWICQSDQYQCQTGQCIKFDWLCDGEWDCADASDEEAIVLIRQWSNHNARLPNFSAQLGKCHKRYSQSPFSKICNVSLELGCYRSNVSNPLNIQSHRPCINLKQIGDGVEDCYNAYDEKNTFKANSYVEGMWGFHFRCESTDEVYLGVCTSNSKLNCTDILCSKYRDTTGLCSAVNDFICLKDNQCKINGRCDGKIDCSDGEDEYWCPSGSHWNRYRYRFDKNDILRLQTLNISLIEYPKKLIVMPIEQQVLKSVPNLQKNQLFQNHSYLCNRGISVFQMNNIRCLCPPSYYGSRCQFYSDRISVIVHLDRQTMPKLISNTQLKIQVRFFFNKIIIDQYEFHLIPKLEIIKIMKHKFYLLYSHLNSMIQHKRNRYSNRTDIIINHPYAIHFILFTLDKNNSPKELGAWHYPIFFDYLPVFHLATILKFPSSFGNATSYSCRQKNYKENSTCLPIFNQNNSFYYSCHSGYYGLNCTFFEPLCDTYCSSNSFCQPNIFHQQINRRKPHCLCPLNHFGSGCHLKYDVCDVNTCENNGTCNSSYDRSGEEPFVCHCSMRFYGGRCQYEKKYLRVQLNMTTKLSTRATVLQLYNIQFPWFNLHIIHQGVHEGSPSIITYYHPDQRAPLLGLLKTYQNSEDPQYFLMYALDQSVINITSSPQHCPHVSSLLPKDIDQSVPIVFQYHRMCQNDTRHLCFYDEHYFCVCQSNDFRAECFIHDTERDHCDKCLLGGKCLQGNSTDSTDFLCLCPSCHRGHRCEFNLEAFGFTLDSLLVRSTKEVKIVYLSIVILLSIIGFFNNSCAFMTFKRPTPRKFGTGTYLLLVSCFNQLALFCLLVKFIEITFGISSVFSCRLITYFLSVMTRSTYWLTSWITVDRMLIILFPYSLSLQNARLAIRMSIATLIILLSMHIHEIIFYTIIQDYSTGLLICVADWSTGFVSVYNRLSTPTHYIIPFLIQTISITLLIVFATRSRVKATGQKTTFYRALKTQLDSQKELYITPALVIFSIAPQIIVAFSLACKELNEGQSHMLLCTYLLSYAPQVLGFILYVLPSTSYKKEFSETSMGKKFFKWMFKK